MPTKANKDAFWTIVYVAAVTVGAVFFGVSLIFGMQSARQSPTSLGKVYDSSWVYVIFGAVMIGAGIVGAASRFLGIGRTKAKSNSSGRQQRQAPPPKKKKASTERRSFSIGSIIKRLIGLTNRTRQNVPNRTYDIFTESPDLSEAPSERRISGQSKRVSDLEKRLSEINDRLGETTEA